MSKKLHCEKLSILDYNMNDFILIFDDDKNNEAKKNQSFFDCTGPNIINIYLDKSTGLRVAMTIAHELMHIYFHKLKHLHKNIININGEEGLCELVAFYVGVFIKSNINHDTKYIKCSYESTQMLNNVEKETFNNFNSEEYHIYKNYKLYFLKAYIDYKKYNVSLISYINETFLLKGVVKITENNFFETIIQKNDIIQNEQPEQNKITKKKKIQKELEVKKNNVEKEFEWDPKLLKLMNKYKEKTNENNAKLIKLRNDNSINKNLFWDKIKELRKENKKIK